MPHASHSHRVNLPRGERPDLLAHLPFHPAIGILPLCRREVLYDKCLEVSGLEGCAAEVGMGSGRATRIIAEALPDTKVYGFDTFSGIPDAAEQGEHEPGAFAFAYEDVLEWTRDLGNLEIRKGLFPDTAVGLEHLQFKLVHADVDIRWSMERVLDFFHPRMVPGGYIVVDDIGAEICRGLTECVKQFLQDHSDVDGELTLGQGVIRKL